MKKFDPFKYRLARDIRNSLSKSLLESLAEGDVSIFKNKAAEYLEQDLDHVYQIYLQSRLGQYEDAFAVIRQAHLDDILLQAEVFWDYGLFFEMHEILEKIWIEATGNERKALQALIRAAGMKIHAENGNRKAAVSIGQKAKTGLQLYGKDLKGFNRLESILADIEDILISMEDSP